MSVMRNPSTRMMPCAGPSWGVDQPLICRMWTSSGKILYAFLCAWIPIGRSQSFAISSMQPLRKPMSIKPVRQSSHVFFIWTLWEVWPCIWYICFHSSNMSFQKSRVMWWMQDLRGTRMTIYATYIECHLQELIGDCGLIPTSFQRLGITLIKVWGAWKLDSKFKGPIYGLSLVCTGSTGGAQENKAFRYDAIRQALTDFLSLEWEEKASFSIPGWQVCLPWLSWQVLLETLHGKWPGLFHQSTLVFLCETILREFRCSPVWQCKLRCSERGD